MSFPDNPCKDCKAPKRHIGCHGDCLAYLEWKEQWVAQQRRIRTKIQMEQWTRPGKPVRKRKSK